LPPTSIGPPALGAETSERPGLERERGEAEMASNQRNSYAGQKKQAVMAPVRAGGLRAAGKPKTAPVLQELKEASGNQNLEFLLCDLSRMADVRRAAEEFKAQASE
jgi:hypothetical protein